MLEPLPTGAWAFLAVTTAIFTKVLTFPQAFGAFTNDVIWLIVVSFFFAAVSYPLPSGLFHCDRKQVSRQDIKPLSFLLIFLSVMRKVVLHLNIFMFSAISERQVSRASVLRNHTFCLEERNGHGTLGPKKDLTMKFLIFHWLQGFQKTGLGERVATIFVKLFGKSTLGLAYGLSAAETLLAPAMPSTTARAGGIFMPIINSLSIASGSKPSKT